MQNIINTFEQFMLKHGTHYHQFYVGIAADPHDRLINGHKVNENIPNAYWPEKLNTNVVRTIEKFFINKGCKGGPGGGDVNTCYLYIYLVTNTTIQ